MPAAPILVVLEHAGGLVRPASLAAVTMAREIARLEGGVYDLLLLGDGAAGSAARQVRRLGARAVLLAEDPGLREPTADRCAAALAAAARTRGAGTVAASASTWSKDVLPRAAALLDAGMAGDVIAVESGPEGLRFRRPVYAGSAVAAVAFAGGPRVLTCRAPAWGAPPEAGEESPVEGVPVGELPEGTEFVSREQRDSGRPELTEARVVVTGGRPLRDAGTFNRLVGGLADALGGAVGATRAAVDAGIAPNDWQVGQTGKVVAPELYVACGVSGAVQHLAGMKDAKVIVAINQDPAAPIFAVATYGLVADLFEAMPALAEAVLARKRAGGG